MEMPLMKCGHTAQAINSRTDKPCCVICSGSPEANIIDDSPLDLSGRFARCSYYTGCHSQQSSSIDLAFFEYRGEGSKYAEKECHICGYHSKDWKPNPKNGKICYNNSDKPNPYVCINKGKQCVYGVFEFDRYYCGCHGWN